MPKWKAESVSHNPATIALVDVSSICPSGDERSHIDALDLIALLVRTGCGVEAPAPHAVHEVECRLYGGFRDIAGRPTERGTWLTRHIGQLRGLKDGIRIVPTMAESIASAPGALLSGTFANGVQKMVDTMMSEDAGEFARSGLHNSLLLLSDDDDFVPTVLAISRTTPSTVRWIRQRPIGRNDRHFGPTTVLLTDSRWS